MTLEPTAYLSLTGGLCDIANFSEKLTQADFYGGVYVMPVDVGAGLVFERPGMTADILQALEADRVALVAGPSGAGKSALAWLAASPGMPCAGIGFGASRLTMSDASCS